MIKHFDRELGEKHELQIRMQALSRWWRENQYDQLSVAY